VVWRFRDFLGREVRVGSNRFTDSHFEDTGTEPAPLSLFEVAKVSDGNPKTRLSNQPPGVYFRNTHCIRLGYRDSFPTF
jgi:hypothetical protein